MRKIKEISEPEKCQSLPFKKHYHLLDRSCRLSLMCLPLKIADVTEEVNV